MRCLVTGGAGFLGSHLCERLLNDGHEVICLDNYFTGRMANVAHLRDNRNFELIRHDVTEPILLVAKRVKARILQASTSEVYGDPAVHPQTEDYWGNVNPIGIRSCYDEGKRVAETLFMDYHRQNNVDIRIVRIFNTYGPRMLMNDGRVVSNFIVQALKGEDITIYGDGSQTRSFCYVDDLIEGFVRMMDQDKIIGPVNIGNPGEFTMLELAKEVLDLTGSKSKIVYKPLPGDDPKMRRPNIDLAKSALGWEPTIPLRQGLEKTIVYFEELLKSEG